MSDEQAPRTSAGSTSSAAASRARTSRQRGKALGSPATAPDSGTSSSASSESSSPASSSSKTSRREHRGGSALSAPGSEDLATEPVPLRFLQPTLERLTGERASSLWPTPTASDANGSGAALLSTDSGRHAGTTLTDAAVRMGAVSQGGRALNPDWVETLLGFPIGWSVVPSHQVSLFGGLLDAEKSNGSGSR
jgi:hypothetical protein